MLTQNQNVASQKSIATAASHHHYDIPCNSEMPEGAIFYHADEVRGIEIALP